MITKPSILRRCILPAIILSASVAPALFAQSPVLFSPGNLVLSRSTYSAPASAVPFPGLLVNGAASAADATYPGVFDNETPDPAFGITSPILLDQLTPAGVVLNTLNVTTALAANPNNGVSTIATSFPSKSEMGLNVTPDGTALTFVAYNSAINQLDISNANTLGHLDITNPVNAISPLYADRTIIDVDYLGTIRATPTHAYSGNNGRNVVYGGNNGLFYMAGNAGNNGGSTTYPATVTIANGKNTVALAGGLTTAGISPGDSFSGTNIPAATTVISVTSTTGLVLSANATGTASGTYTVGAAISLVTASTVSITNGSNVVNVSAGFDTGSMFVGTPVSGTNIPVGSYVTSVPMLGQFTISANATGTAAGAYVANEAAIQLPGLTFAAGNPVATISTTFFDTSRLAISMPVSGTNVPAGAYISSINGPNSITLSATPTKASVAAASYTAGLPSSMLSDNTGVQMIARGASGESAVVGKVQGVYGAANGYQRGFTVTQIGAAADKSGKDDNFRGATNYNNTLYITKGSGGNGFDAVYQVNPGGGAYVAPGTSAGLPTGASAATAGINPLPGWPVTSTGKNEIKLGGATTPIVYHPFGAWFANDTTLYVADEGGPTLANGAQGGLQKWTWDGAQWNLNYTLTNGALTGTTLANGTTGGTPYTVTDGTNSVIPTAVGLRNIAGRVNGDGTVTVYAVTSTISSLTDVGADPNQLVAVTDNLSFTTDAQASGEVLTVVKTAQYAEVLRGIAVIPGRISVSRGGFVFDRRTNKFAQQVTLTNDNATAVTGPVYLALDNLSANASLANAVGLTASTAPTGSPYVVGLATGVTLQPGSSTAVSLQFNDPSKAAITYSARTITGTAP